jgi:hypothetical protein
LGVIESGSQGRCLPEVFSQLDHLESPVLARKLTGAGKRVIRASIVHENYLELILQGPECLEERLAKRPNRSPLIVEGNHYR